MSQTSRWTNRGRLFLLVILAGVALMVVGWVTVAIVGDSNPIVESPRLFREAGRLSVWWNGLPAEVRQTSIETGASNIHAGDYAGHESCRECHREKYAAWSRHSHRWMNALANESTVKGDFSGKSNISYLGGEATFTREDGKYAMHLRRGDIHRVYHASQTIGSRFFQYYVGKQVVGPEPPEHAVYSLDHVMAFGYWLDYEQWVPIVHVGPEMPDGQRPDPYDPPFGSRFVSDYAANCNYCHTTFPLSEMLVRNTPLLGRHAPADLHWSLTSYLSAERPELVPPKTNLAASTAAEMEKLFYRIRNVEATGNAVTLGISCEACHLGCKEHVQNPKQRPRFFPASPHLLVETEDSIDHGRTQPNVNWICGRCHAGDRPMFAGGMSTWNSTEFSDASRGSCYSELRCIDCHDPHQAIGRQWSRSADQDDSSCLRCHDELGPDEARRQHTHHPVGSAGARCLNCHMPRMNEGLQDVVRTHTIFSPTKPEPLEANHPNACNLCHTDKPIDWTLKYLREWYGARFSPAKMARHYPQRDQAVALGWLHSESESVRLLAADALIRRRDQAALPQLVAALDDPYLLNRQFALKGLEEWFGVQLSDFGYYFYSSPAERRQPLAKIRSWVQAEMTSASTGTAAPTNTAHAADIQRAIPGTPPRDRDVESPRPER